MSHPRTLRFSALVLILFSSSLAAVGASQTVAAAVPGLSGEPNIREISDSRFRTLIAPLEAHEPSLRLSQLHLPQVRRIIQRTLLPGLDRLHQGITARGWELSNAQKRLLHLYRDRYKAILEWSGTLGSRRDLLFTRLGHLSGLQASLHARPDEDVLAVTAAVAEVFAKELQNKIARIEWRNKDAGFENPGVAYQIRRPDLPAGADAFPFTLWMAPSGRRIGDRMQVTDDAGNLLGRLEFVEAKEGLRRYTGTMSRRAFSALPSLQVWVRYVTRTTFSLSWNRERLRLFLMPSLPKDSPYGFEYETLHGQTPEKVRNRFLQSLGRF